MPDSNIVREAVAPPLPAAAGEVVPAGDPLLEALGELFGHAGFRDGQREIVEAVLRGEDVLAVLPTGAGKSLLYQLPAFLLPGVTIAVSPLIALMKDQLDKLVGRGLPAAALNSALSPDEVDRTFERVARGEIKLLLVAPERFQSPRFRNALSRVKVSLFAVDEAHCVSEWGHDFRPDYDRLGEAAHAIGRPPILAVTATATDRVRRDIARSLDLRPGHRIFIRGFDRPNLHFSVVSASGDTEKAFEVVHAVRKHGREGAVIAYCGTRKNCEKLAARLRSENVEGGVVVYHAGLPPGERRAVQERWQKGEARVVVATNAFGLGIDKQDVRLVVHHDLPGSLEAYYQEAGRAGRDGLASACVLVFATADVHLQNYLAEGSYPDRACVEAVARALAGARGAIDAASLRAKLPSQSWSDRAVATSLRLLEGAGLARADRDESYVAAGPDLLRSELPGIDWDRLERLREHERQKLARVLAYARAVTCRRATILRYFGAPPPAGAGCGRCDRCLAPAGDRVPADEALTAARKVLSLVARLRARFGRGVVARLLAGEVEPEDRQRGIADLPTVGALKPWSVQACGAAIDACLAHELLETYSEDRKYPKLRLTPAGVEVLLGRATADIALLVPDQRKKGRKKAAKSGEATGLDAPGEVLLLALKAWRAEKARDAELPPYCVFHDKTLVAIAGARPTDLAGLLEIPGVGSKKAERYGEELLELIASGGVTG